MTTLRGAKSSIADAIASSVCGASTPKRQSHPMGAKSASVYPKPPRMSYSDCACFAIPITDRIGGPATRSPGMSSIASKNFFLRAAFSNVPAVGGKMMLSLPSRSSLAGKPGMKTIGFGMTMRVRRRLSQECGADLVAALAHPLHRLRHRILDLRVAGRNLPGRRRDRAVLHRGHFSGRDRPVAHDVRRRRVCDGEALHLLELLRHLVHVLRHRSHRGHHGLHAVCVALVH